MVFCLMLGMMIGRPAPARAADNKDILSLQRDVASLEQDIKDLQKALDSKMATLQAMVQQSLDTANRTNSSVTSINSGVTQTMQSELRGVKDQLNSVTSLSTTVTNISSDVSNVVSSVQDLQRTVNRQGQQISDMLNQLKLMQSPTPAQPPGADSGMAPPPPDPGKLFSHAATDMDGGKSDLALTEFTEFLHLYPNDPVNALRAQYNIGNIYYTQGKLDEAVKALDAAIEQYAVDQTITPSAYYMKGLALKKERKNPEAIASFRRVVTDFPHSNEAGQARSQLTSMGATVAPPKKATR
jgi:TolA-binding protein